MQEIDLPHEWEPRPYQQDLWDYLEGGGKRAAAVWHRRAGKDDLCLRWASVAVFEKAATYWHMLPEAAQARKAIWTAVNPHTGKRRIDEAFPLALRANTNDQEMFIRFKNGSTWQVVGSDNYNSLVGSPPAGVVFSEWPLNKPEAWTYLEPILEENGGWALFIYTPRGENHGLSMLQQAQSEPDWFGQVLTADETEVFDAEQLARIKRGIIKQYGKSRGEAFFNQEYYCSFYEAFSGKVVYPDFNRKQHVATCDLLPFVLEGIAKGGQIGRGWDNTGLHPASVVTYTNSIGQLYIVREFWGDDITCVDFASEVLLWCNQNFPVGTEYRDIADPAGRYRDSMKKSPAQYVWEELRLRLEDGIQTFKVRQGSVNRLLNMVRKGEPALVVDPSCVNLIKGFEGAYCYPEIGKSGVYRDEPLKDMFADLHDSLAYYCTRIFGAANEEEDGDYYPDNKKEGRSKSGGY